MLSRLAVLPLLALAVVLAAAAFASCEAGGATTHVPRVGERLPRGRPAAPPPRAPADPAAGRHLALTLNVDDDDATLAAAPAAGEGWGAGYPSGATDLRVRLYDARGRALYEAGLPDPLAVRVYGGEDGPHGRRPEHGAAVPLTLPVLAEATHLVVALDDRVVLVRELP